MVHIYEITLKEKGREKKDKVASENIKDIDDK